jgi:hypothetical protein
MSHSPAQPERFQPQPWVGIASASLAVALLGLAWLGALPNPTTPALSTVDGPLTLAACLIAGIIAGYHYPIHIGHKVKISMASVPLYLLAALLAPPLAAAAAGLGVLAAELSVRVQRKLPLSASITAAARWVPVILLGALIAHIPGPDVAHIAALVGAAILIGIGDILTIALVIAPLTGDRPRHIIVAAAHEAYLAEGAQYLLGLMAALEAEQRAWTVLLIVLPTALVYRAFKVAKEMQETTRGLLENMADTVDLRDPYTGGHSRRVTDYSIQILRQMGLEGPEVALIRSAARVHDIGKIAIPDGILNKPDKLDAEERAIIESHSERGADFLSRYPDFARGVGIVRHHHEAWDGSGYPHRLKGSDIPFGARVIAVADSFDAMTSDRPYRKGMPAHKAAAILREGRGRQWDARVVDAFLRGITDQVEQPMSLLHIVPMVEAPSTEASAAG